MSIIKRFSVIAIGCSIALASGCSKDNGKPLSPGFDDGAPPTPTTEKVQNNLPDPMALNKGMASAAIDHSVSLAAGKLNINEQLKLKHILSGYNSFDEYLFEAQIRDKGRVKTLYASNGRYDEKTNKFVVQAVDLVGEAKKSLVT